ncbi:MAG: hypothetical protein ACRD0P_00925 [Stackebrandtia sp.]
MNDNYPYLLNEAVCKLYNKALEVSAKHRLLPYDPDSDAVDSEKDAGTTEQHGISTGEWNDMAEGLMRIFDMFDGYDQPDPQPSRDIIAACKAARGRIENNDDADLGKASDDLKEYTSLALDSFRTNVVDKFENAQHQQLTALLSLEGIADANRQTIEDKRDHAMSFADQGYRAIDKLDNAGPGPNGWQVAIAVLFVAGGAVAMPFAGSGAALISTGLYLAGSTASLGEAMKSGEKVGTQPEGQISGGSVDEVLQSIQTALSQLDAEVEASIETMNLTAQHNVEVLAGDKRVFLPSPNNPRTDTKEPDIAEIDDPGAGMERRE